MSGGPYSGGDVAGGGPAGSTLNLEAVEGLVDLLDTIGAPARLREQAATALDLARIGRKVTDAAAGVIVLRVVYALEVSARRGGQYEAADAVARWIVDLEMWLESAAVVAVVAGGRN